MEDTVEKQGQNAAGRLTADLQAKVNLPTPKKESSAERRRWRRPVPPEPAELTPINLFKKPAEETRLKEPRPVSKLNQEQLLVSLKTVPKLSFSPSAISSLRQIVEQSKTDRQLLSHLFGVPQNQTETPFLVFGNVTVDENLQRHVRVNKFLIPVLEPADLDIRLLSTGYTPQGAEKLKSVVERETGNDPSAELVFLGHTHPEKIECRLSAGDLLTIRDDYRTIKHPRELRDAVRTGFLVLKDEGQGGVSLSFNVHGEDSIYEQHARVENLNSADVQIRLNPAWTKINSHQLDLQQLSNWS